MTTTQPFTPVERAVMAQLVEDHAGDYYGGPLHLGRSDAARYTSEGHILRELPDRTLREVWQWVAGYLDQHPGILDRRLTDVERAARNQARKTIADGYLDKALAVIRAGDYQGAVDLVDTAELAAPLYRPATRSWDELRGFVRQHQAAGTTP